MLPLFKLCSSLELSKLDESYKTRLGRIFTYVPKWICSGSFYVFGPTVVILVILNVFQLKKNVRQYLFSGPFH